MLLSLPSGSLFVLLNQLHVVIMVACMHNEDFFFFTNKVDMIQYIKELLTIKVYNINNILHADDLYH